MPYKTKHVSGHTGNTTEHYARATAGMPYATANWCDCGALTSCKRVPGVLEENCDGCGDDDAHQLELDEFLREDCGSVDLQRWGLTQTANQGHAPSRAQVRVDGGSV